MTYWTRWKYKNITLLVLSIIFAFSLSRLEAFHIFLLNLGDLGYIGAFIAGVLFVSSFTVATGVIILFVLAEKLSPLEISILAGLGAVVGDYLIFRFVKDTLAQEVSSIYHQLDKKSHLQKVLHSKYFSWTLPVLGALIIASPLPDEIGVSLMGISKMKVYQFLLISFLLNALGIFLIISISTVISS